MQTELCNDCPAWCVGQEYSTACGSYSGPDIPEYGISTGDSLQSVITKLATNQASEVVSSSDMCTDDIITTSLVRNPAASCAAKVVERSFTYSLNSNVSSSSFSWDMSDTINSLPKDYEVAVVNVQATGKDNGTGTIIATTNKASAGLNIDLNRYPITVDLNLRLLTPCGNLDLNKSVNIAGPGNNITRKLNFTVRGIVQDDSGDYMLTTQLDSLESEVQQINGELKDLQKIELSSFTGDIKGAIIGNDSKITDINSTLSDPSSFEIDYTSGSSNLSDSISTVISDLYSKIEQLSSDLAARDVTINTLQAEVASLNSQI